MADEGAMRNAGEEEDDGIDKPVRAKPFSYLELIDLVEYMERKQYAKPPKEQTYRRKLGILQKISRKLQRKHGTQRSPRQIQKRYSDLKVRQEDLLQEIRREIGKQTGAPQDTPCEIPVVESAESLENTPSCSTDIPLPEQDYEQEDEEETYTLQLEAIDLPVNLETQKDYSNQGVNAGQLQEIIVQIQTLKEVVSDLDKKITNIVNTVQNMLVT